MSPQILAMLDLKSSVIAESTSIRNLIPREDGWDQLRCQAKRYANYITNLLKAGYQSTPQVEVAARKPGHGVRPIPYWAPADRTIYRALTEAALNGQISLDRGPEAYLRFVRAPLDYAMSLQEPTTRVGLFFGNTPIRYVVKSDITAFYQFVDHDVLAKELVAQGADFGVVDALVTLLFEIQGRRFGLPQLLSSSDRLSELYIDKIERSLLREGMAVWRFNDDFRIACRSYPEVLNVIEAISVAARDNGLVVNDNKTTSLYLFTYAMETLGLQTSDLGDAVRVDDVETVVGDYTEEFPEDALDVAAGVVNNAKAAHGGDHSLDLRSVSTSGTRQLRRALGALTKYESPLAIGNIVEVLRYVPSITPSVARYLKALASQQLTITSRACATILETVTLNDWQLIWIISVIEKLFTARLAMDSTEGIYLRNELGELRSSPNTLVRAAAAKAMAADRQITLQELITESTFAVGSVLSTYLQAIAELIPQPRNESDSAAILSLAKTDVLHSVLLGQG